MQVDTVLFVVGYSVLHVVGKTLFVVNRHHCVTELAKVGQYTNVIQFVNDEYRTFANDGDQYAQNRYPAKQHIDKRQHHFHRKHGKVNGQADKQANGFADDVEKVVARVVEYPLEPIEIVFFHVELLVTDTQSPPHCLTQIAANACMYPFNI